MGVNNCVLVTTASHASFPFKSLVLDVSFCLCFFLVCPRAPLWGVKPGGTEVEGWLERKVWKLLERSYQGKNMVKQGKTQVYTLVPNLHTVWTWTILRLSFLTYKLMAEVVFFKSWRGVLTVLPSGAAI